MLRIGDHCSHVQSIEALTVVLPQLGPWTHVEMTVGGVQEHNRRLNGMRLDIH